MAECQQHSATNSPIFMQLVQGYFGVLAKDLVTTGKRYALRAVIWQWANGLFWQWASACALIPVSWQRAARFAQDFC
jgi:hypothetical protein